MVHNKYIGTLLFLLAIVSVNFIKSQPSPALPVQISVATARERRLGDDCLFVYLDVGANLGVHTRFLFEPEKYPSAKVAQKIFQRTFGSNLDNRDVCSFGFEPNPAHIARHQQLEESYSKMGWRYKFINAGVSDDNGNLTFYHQGDVRNEEWGFSLAKRGKNAVGVTVPLVDFNHWLETHILGRRPPSQIYGKYTENDGGEGKVLMKMDIEGSEYMVLPSIIFSGVFCKTIDVAFGEMHPKFNVSRKAIDKDGQGVVNLKGVNGAKAWYDNLMIKALKSVHPKDCKARWIYADDESHRHDGEPMPTPN